MSRLLALTVLALSLSACAIQGNEGPVFQKAEGYPCQDRVIHSEYVVRLKDDSIITISAENDDAFLTDYFEKNRENIKTAEPNYTVSIDTTPNSHASGVNASSTFDNWGTEQIRADSFWSKGYRGEGVLVAVVDTGVDINHPKLKNQIYENVGEVGTDSSGRDKRFNGIDDDGNGYIDDWKGYNFVTQAGLAGDNSDHGTHVSGIILAEHNDMIAGRSINMQGVAPKAKLLPVAFLGSNGSGSIEHAVLGVAYAAKQGARIINASWGGSGCSITLKDEVRKLSEKNVLFVSAAGNSGRDLSTFPEYPASFEALTQLTVGSIDPTMLISTFSNFSSRFVHLFAPGGSITSTIPGNNYASFNGTSMATPFVSGAAALMLSANPMLSAIDLKQKILQSIVTGNYDNQTHGRLVLKSP